ncbi:MAG: leucine-rich repeat protein, partial [Candidatus Methanomethylophilaceae archaeon]|nr:leucine-rich repeat protein [Candidatus Methanomethylophilaceae archaeon]
MGTSVVLLGNNLFKNCTSLKSISASNLSEIQFDVFSGCTSLSEVKLNSGLKTIGENAFRGCTSLVALILPDTVNAIGSFAFAECSALKSVNIPKSTTAIPTSLFEGDSSLSSITIPGSVQSFGTRAFRNCTSLASVTLEEGVTVIVADELFSNCAFKSISIPSTVYDLNLSKFERRQAMWPSSLESITVSKDNPNYSSADGILFDKSGSTVLVCPMGKTGSAEIQSNIDDYAFWHSSLKNVTLKEGVKSIGNNAFRGSSIESINLPESIEKLKELAFYSCTNLKTIDIPDSLKAIPDSAYDSCSSLMLRDLPSKLESVGAYAFRNCPDVVLDKLPESLRFIGSWAFYGTGIENIEIGIPNEVTIGGSSFGGESLKSVTLGKVSVEGVEKEEYKFILNGNGLESVTVTPDFTLWKQIGPLSIGPGGELYSCIPAYKGSITVPSDVTSVFSAFQGCAGITGIVFEDLSGTVTIGSGNMYRSGSFDGCASLTSVRLPNVILNENYTFRGCGSLKEVTVSTIDRIGDLMFSATSLSKFTADFSKTTYVGMRAFEDMDIESFDASGMHVSKYAFRNCSNLKTFKTDEKTVLDTGCLAGTGIKSLTLYLDNAVPLEISYGTSTMKGIASRLCEGCTNLSDVKIVKGGSSRMVIGEGTFEGCKSLREIEIPKGLDRVYNEQRAFRNSGLESFSADCNRLYLNINCFSDCLSLKSIYANTANGNYIPALCFAGCASLSDVSINNIDSTDLSAFLGCKSLESLKIGGRTLTIIRGTGFEGSDFYVKTIDIGDFRGDPKSMELFSNCPSIENYICTEDNSTYFVQNGAVYQIEQSVPSVLLLCSKSVSDLSIPPTVTAVGEHAFDGCPSVISVSFPEGLESFGYAGPEVRFIDSSGSQTLDPSKLAGRTFMSRPGSDGLVRCPILTFTADGITAGSVVYTWDGKANIPDVPPKEGYAGEWEDFSGASEDREVKAVYTKIVPRISTVTFDSDGGTPVESISAEAGTVLAAPADPSRTGYTFAGWDPSLPSSMPSEDLVVKAKWKINSYTITFDSDGGSPVESITREYGSPVSPPDNPVREGYSFAGWNPSVPQAMPAENLIVKAVWIEIVPVITTVSFDTDGGSPVESITQEAGTPLSPPADPVRTGYSFEGWEPSLPAVMPGTDLKLTAKWKINSYTITFDSCGGSSVSEITGEYGSDVAPPSDPVRKGYAFSGWEPSVPSSMPAENITVKAVWIKLAPRMFTLSFDSDGGT